jgi:hypothetical protein
MIPVLNNMEVEEEMRGDKTAWQEYLQSKTRKGGHQEALRQLVQSGEEHAVDAGKVMIPVRNTEQMKRCFPPAAQKAWLLLFTLHFQQEAASDERAGYTVGFQPSALLCALQQLLYDPSPYSDLNIQLAAEKACTIMPDPHSVKVKFKPYNGELKVKFKYTATILSNPPQTMHSKEMICRLFANTTQQQIATLHRKQVQQLARSIPSPT